MAGEGQGRGLLIAGGILLVLGIAGVGIAIGVFISPASQVQDEIGALKTQLFEIEEKLNGSEVLADLPSGLEQIVSSQSWECPDGTGSSQECKAYLARNILTLDVDRRDLGNGNTNVQFNYWLAERPNTGFVMSLGRSSTVWGVTLRNTQNSWYQSFSTKKFKVLGGPTASGPWEELLVYGLEDSRRQNPPPVQQIMFANPANPANPAIPAVVSFIKFELLEYWGSGGGLQYFVPIYRAK